MKNRKAFTLIELLVVVAIIGILAAIGVVSFGGFTESAKKKTVIANYNMMIKYINSELMKCELGLEIEAAIKQKSDPNKYHYLSTWGCKEKPPGNQYNARFVYTGNNILSYLHNYEGEFNIKNPWHPEDEYPVNINARCPSNMPIGPTNVTIEIGRVNVSVIEDQKVIFVCARYGEGIDDIIQTKIKNPY
jgi:prepilin-type N-terminal cleavage/methylation domain-containing protein